MGGSLYPIFPARLHLRSFDLFTSNQTILIRQAQVIKPIAKAPPSYPEVIATATFSEAGVTSGDPPLEKPLVEVDSLFPTWENVLVILPK